MKNKSSLTVDLIGKGGFTHGGFNIKMCTECILCI